MPYFAQTLSFVLSLILLYFFNFSAHFFVVRSCFQEGKVNLDRGNLTKCFKMKVADDGNVLLCFREYFLVDVSHLDEEIQLIAHQSPQKSQNFSLSDSSVR